MQIAVYGADDATSPPSAPRDGRLRVMVLLSEVPIVAEDTDAPHDDVDDDDAPMQGFRLCLQAIESGNTARKLRH